MKKINLMTMMNDSLLKLPTPTNISYWWNFGSLLGMFLGIQIISGFILSMHYCPNTLMAFNSIIHIMQNVNYGWLMHNIHINGASMFFICMYTHIGRGLYYNSFMLKNTWMVGVSIFFISMATAFLGYVLPWGQMSFWGATVITNLVSTIPYMGTMIVQWLWGGFSINNATLNRFYSIHFILPFMILMMVLLHLFFLHNTGSSNPLGLNSNYNKIPFNSYFTLKDMFGFMIFLLIFTIIILQYPYMFSDPDNFIPANPMVTPVHIQPEWYFLFAYAILRSIPSKLGGVLALLMSIMILYIMPLMSTSMNTMGFYPFSQFLYWTFINIFILLTWIGAQPIEYPYVHLSQILSLSYFLYFILLFMSYKYWDKHMFY
ncbi:cytochrome b (mitochondrion) [Linepithema humile]|uniref:Cytochrome b n=3 Tax=Linepithema humile TaxID=83485 RepID=A0A191TFT3_LINHU|nr:cytochrome b [Linepithema humile]ANI87485.1 cytochrome b [Linepithema humile]